MDFNSIQEFKNNYAKIYHGSVVKLLVPLEQERLKTKNTIIILWWVIALLAVLWLVLSPKFAGNDIFLYLFMGMGVICIIAIGYISKSFEQKLKEKVMPELMKAFGNFIWTEASVISSHTLKETRLFKKFSNKSDDDNFYGTYKGLNVNIDETKLTYTTRDSKGNSRTHTEFEGVIIEVDVKKNFKGHTIIRLREFLLQDKAYEEVKLEDPEFSKQYYVDSNDQIEARYLLTTSFMERYKNIQKVFNAKLVEASFKDSKLILALYTSKDLFKIGNIYRPVNDTKQFTELLNEFVAILAIIDELKLNQNIGL